jgi:hypothetical protein
MKNILYLLLSGAAILCLPNALWAQCEFVINAPDGDELTCSMTSLQLNAVLTNVDDTWTYTYSWSGPGNLMSPASQITVSTPGDYSLKVTGSSMNGNQECMETKSIEISQVPPPDVSILPENPQICPGQQITLTALPPNASSYSWSNGSTAQSITVSTGGSYAVTVGANGCSGDASTFVEELQSPMVSISPPNPQICPGQPITLTASPPNASSYSWRLNNEVINNEFGPSITVSTGGTYSVTVTGANGCMGVGATAVGALLQPTVAITGNGAVCSGDGRELKAIANTTVTLYIWERRNADGSWTEVAQGNALMTFVTGSLTQSTTYRVIVETPCGEAESDSVMVNVVAKPEPTIDGPTAVCRGQQVIYRLEGDAATIRSSTITWDAGTGQNTAQLSPLSGGAILVSWGNDPGTFNLGVTQQLGTCDASADLSVTVGSAAATTQPTEIRYYDLNNIFISRDPDADCYQWGYYDPSNNRLEDIPGETYQAYAAGEAYNPDRTYWVKTWNGDCGAMPDCANISFLMQPEEEPELPTKENITLYPNPNDGNCFLQATGLPLARYTLAVTDVMGRKLLQQPLNVQDGQAEAQIALPRAANGLYHAILVEPNGRLFKAIPFLVLR